MLAIPGPVARSSAPQVSKRDSLNLKSPCNQIMFRRTSGGLPICPLRFAIDRRPLPIRSEAASLEYDWFPARPLGPAHFPERHCAVGSPVVKAATTMTRKQDRAVHRKKGRSADQRQWTAAVARASRAWEDLTDEQRLVWNTEAKTRRTSGQRLFTGITARRFRDGRELQTGLPRPASYGPTRILKQLVITNRRGRITLKLELFSVPTARFTVWASRPCHRGLPVCDKCPRLGPLPPPHDGCSDITALYFQKHGAYIDKCGVQLAGKRIFVRIREEMDDGARLYEPAWAVVPAPEGGDASGKKE